MLEENSNSKCSITFMHPHLVNLFGVHLTCKITSSNLLIIPLNKSIRQTIKNYVFALNNTHGYYAN